MEDKKCLDVQSPEVSHPCDVTRTDPSSSKTVTTVARVQRNVAEKLRRDKLNGYISELATIVPIVARAAKRMDKTSILRLSAAYLRICKSPLNGRRKMKSFKWCPNFLNPDHVREIMESVDGFLLVAESTGKILFTSRSVERYLGHQDIDMVGHALHMFIHPEDVEIVKGEINRLLFAFSKNDVARSIPRCSFHCRMKEKSQPRSEVQTYQFVHIMGAMTLVEEEGSENPSKRATPTLKAFIRVVDADPYNQLSLEEAIADEYVTRHSLDGTIIFADHRLSTITGHMPHEVTGLNAYMYIHMDDAKVSFFAQQLMFSSGRGTGMIVYRLRTSDDKYVFLKSVGYLQYDSSGLEVDHFVCVNQQLSESEGRSQLKYFTDRYLPHIKGSTAIALQETVKSLQSCGRKSVTLTGNKIHNLNSMSFPYENVKLKDSENNCNVSPQEESGCNGIKSEMEDVQFPTATTNFVQTSLANSGGTTFVYTTPLVSTTCNENLSDGARNTEEYPNENGMTKIFGGARTTNNMLNSQTDGTTDNFTENVYSSSASNLCNSVNGSLVTSEDSLHVRTNYIISADNHKPVCLAASINSDAPFKVVQLQQLQLLHVLNKGESGDQEMNAIYSKSTDRELNSLCSENLLMVKDFQGASGMCVDNSDFFTQSGGNGGIEPRQEIHSSNGKDSYSENNTRSSTLDSDDSDTITLMSPMCPMRKSSNFIHSDTKVGSSNSSMDFCNDAYGHNSEESKETLSIHDDFSTLLASTLPHEDSISSIPSSNNEWSDFYQPPELLDPLNSEELALKDDDLASGNIKVELW